MRETKIPEPIAQKTVGDLEDYVLILHGTIRQCNADKEMR